MFWTIFFYQELGQKWLIWACGLRSKEATETIVELEAAGYTVSVEPY